MNLTHIFEKIFAWLHKRSLFTRYVIAIGMTIGLAFVDYSTGTDFNFSFFYLVPVSMTAWFISIEMGYAMCVIAGVVWGVLNEGDQPWTSILFPIWNAIMRMLFYFVTTKLLSIVSRAFEKERLLSRTDYLTGVFNSRHIYEVMGEELERYKRYGHDFVLAYIDLDNFKKVNDTKGHSEGDLVLKTTTSRMREILRKTDKIGRMGGDEFVVLMPHTGLKGAESALKKLERELLAEMQKHDWPVTFSIGVIAPKREHVRADDMIRSADALMYKVKGGGKNAILFEAS